MRFSTRVHAGFGIGIWLTVWFGPSSLEGAAPERDGVTPVIAIKARPFELEDVRLLPGPFRHAMELDEKYLLALDVDRLLHTFRVNAGLPSSAKPLGRLGRAQGRAPRPLRRPLPLGLCADVSPAPATSGSRRRASSLVAGLAECQAARAAAT